MYGMVNQAVRGLVVDQFGSEVWGKIHEGAGARENFSAMEPYDDSITYRLVENAVEVLGIPADTILRTFGEYWVHEIAKKHYGSLLSNTGSDFADFLGNLDHMHQRIRVTFPDYQPPSFRVKQLEEGTLQVDYYSNRQGLLPFVEGLFTGLGAHFSVTVEFEHIPDDTHPTPGKRMVVRYAAAT